MDLYTILKQTICLTIIIPFIVLGCSGGSTPVYVLEVTPTPAEGGSVTPASGEFEEGEVVEIMAQPNENYMFDSWQGDVTGSENPVEIVMESDKIFTALFEKLEFTLEVNIEGMGEVDRNVVEAKTADYESGTIVELTAEPDFGWTFVEWQGDLQGDENPQTILMDEDKSVTAVFERREFTINTETDGSGTIDLDPDKSSYLFEEEVTITAIPDDGWQFDRWEGDVDGSNNPEQIVIDENKTITAVFEREGYELTINKDGDGNVQTEVIEEPAKSTTHPFETLLELTAEPSAGWEFSHWEGDLSGTSNPEQILMDEDKEVTAVFEMEEYSLTTNTDGNGSIDVDPDQSSYQYGDEVTVTAEPDDGWDFVEWQGDLSGNSNPETITMNGDKSITAVFEADQYSVNTSTDGNGSVSLDPDKSSYSYNENVTITASPASGWEFDGWQGDLAGSNNPESFTVTSNMSITAVFSEIPITERACYSYSEGEIITARDQMLQIYNSARIPTNYHNLAESTAEFYDDILDELDEILAGDHDEDLFQIISTVQNAIQDDILTSDNLSATEEVIGMYLYYELSLLYFYIHSCRDDTIEPLPQHVRIPNWGEVTNSFQQEKSSSLTNMLNNYDVEEKFDEVDNRFSDRYDNDLQNIMNAIFQVFTKYGS